MLRTWRITPTQNLRLETVASNLDEITQHLPEGYYSTFRTFAGGTRVLGLSSHLRRLYEPVAAPEVDEHTLRRQLHALLESYGPHEARVRAMMSRQGQAYLAIAPLVPLPPEIYENGVRVETTGLQREHPRLKSTSFIGRSDSERKHIAQEGIFEALLVKDGKILEGMTSNFFYGIRAPAGSPGLRERKEWRRSATNAVEAHASSSLVPTSAPRSTQREITLYTAHDDVLLGVTRKTVIGIAQERGLQVNYEPLNLDQLATIDEAFITSSSRGIVPIVQIDHVTLGQGRPGLLTKALMDAYEEYVINKAEEI